MANNFLTTESKKLATWYFTFAAIIFGLSGLLGLIIKNSGIVNSDYLLLPVFIGFYGFGSLLAKRQEKRYEPEDHKNHQGCRHRGGVARCRAGLLGDWVRSAQLWVVA